MAVFMWLYILCTEMHLSSAQFKSHIDLQKVSEIMFKNEKYNVLKPTIHIIKDHFKDFIQKRHNQENSRIFIDRNGFRHIWQGMEVSGSESLRKADLAQEKIIETPEDKTIKEMKAVELHNTTKKIKDKPRRKKKIVEDVYVPEKITLRDNPTLVTTTFFCPFFGIIKMSSEVNNSDENKNATTKR
ncbi:unnamed protein product, partial [Brenthis ino]